jgi:peptide/nickel transport system permease protein
MPEPSRSSTTSPVDVPTSDDDVLTPTEDEELAAGAIAVDDAIEEVELAGSPSATGVRTVVARPATAKRRFGPFFWIAVGGLVLLIFLAVFADFLPFVKDPEQVYRSALARSSNGRIVAAKPSAEHWFGGDADGRDLFSRVVYGARVSLIVGVSSIGIGLGIGGILGLLGGYFRGRPDSFIVSLANIMLAFPPLILALALVAFMGQNLRNVIVALAIVSIPSLTRITRAATLTFSQREFVLAARTLGASHFRVITREILPNVVPPMAAFALLAIAVVIVAEGTLSFLGLSVESPAVSWGGLIQGGRQQLDETPHVSLIPCGVMFLTLLAMNYVGDKLQAAWNVREVRL